MSFPCACAFVLVHYACITPRFIHVRLAYLHLCLCLHRKCKPGFNFRGSKFSRYLFIRDFERIEKFAKSRCRENWIRYIYSFIIPAPRQKSTKRDESKRACKKKKYHKRHCLCVTPLVLRMPYFPRLWWSWFLHPDPTPRRLLQGPGEVVSHTYFSR